jgi:hypothetical protein
MDIRDVIGRKLIGVGAIAYFSIVTSNRHSEGLQLILYPAAIKYMLWGLIALYLNFHKIQRFLASTVKLAIINMNKLLL